MATEKLLKTLPVLQSQIDALLEFDCSPNELSNGVINAAFMLLFKDLIRLFACYNDGIINLLGEYSAFYFYHTVLYHLLRCKTKNLMNERNLVKSPFLQRSTLK